MTHHLQLMIGTLTSQYNKCVTGNVLDNHSDPEGDTPMMDEGTPVEGGGTTVDLPDGGGDRTIYLNAPGTDFDDLERERVPRRGLRTPSQTAARIQVLKDNVYGVVSKMHSPFLVDDLGHGSLGLAARTRHMPPCRPAQLLASSVVRPHPIR